MRFEFPEGREEDGSKRSWWVLGKMELKAEGERGFEGGKGGGGERVFSGCGSRRQQGWVGRYLFQRLKVLDPEELREGNCWERGGGRAVSGE